MKTKRVDGTKTAKTDTRSRQDMSFSNLCAQI